ncbi:MAG: hypothetical protein ACI9OU_001034 [Candidatus Promineifilaceae bacterium]|jgi:hypothetical protein
MMRPRTIPIAHPIAIYLSMVCLGLPARALSADNIQFEQDIWPIIESSCLDCHLPTHVVKGKIKKPKAGLVLNSASAIMRGGDNGAVVVPGNPLKSSLFTLTMLDPDDDDVMPAKGDALTESQQALLHNWIKQGAEFGRWLGAADTTPDGKKRVERLTTRAHPLDVLAADLQKIPQNSLARYTRATVTQVSKENPLLRLAYDQDPTQVTDSDIAQLGPLGNHLTIMRLAHTRTTDKSMPWIGSLKRLTRLDLQDTGITDAGLAHLRTLPALVSLNLNHTAISNDGLRHLVALNNLEHLYLWKTEVTDIGFKELGEAMPETDIRYTGLLPYPETAPTNSLSADSDRRSRRKKR